MFEFFKNIITTLLNDSVESFYIYILYFFSLLLVIILCWFFYIVGKMIFSSSNYTMRILLLSAPKPRKKETEKNKLIIFLEDQFNKTILKRIYLNNRLMLEKGGIYTHNRLVFLVLTRWIFIPILAFWTYVVKMNFLESVISFLFFEGLIWAVLIYSIHDEAKKFQKVSYRLFKFIRNQMSSGIRITDVINSLHMVVSEPLLKKRLILMSAHYASTNDIDRALTYITDYYQTLESKSLALSIKQAIETGQKGNGFEHKERKLFNMFINVIKKDTQLVMLRYFFIGVLYGIVIVIIAGYPMWMDLTDANRLLFGN